MSIQHLLEKQKLEFKKFKFWDCSSLSDWEVESFLSTIQQEILQVFREKVEGMKMTPSLHEGCTLDDSYCYNHADIMKKEDEPNGAFSYNQALSDLSSWLEGDKK